ncbi:MAG: dihydropyrimidinase [Thermoanaerobaculia bacterium]|nr:dihydropyrimidinase [Thermoanaerobaculia bacterium]
MGLLIENGTLVGADGERRADLLCRAGRIAAVGRELPVAPDDRVVDAAGMLVFPGGVDPHVHLSLPVAGTVSADDFDSGTAAALAGGTTTLVDFVHPERGQDPLEALAARREQAATSRIDYGLHMALTWWGEAPAAAVRRCVEEEGIPTFKLYMTYRETVGLDDADLLLAMAAVGAAGGQVVIHAEHHELVEFLRRREARKAPADPASHARSRPPGAEGEAVERAIWMAGEAGVPLYVFHVTCREAVEALTRARRRGAAVAGETCPHYLLLDDSVYRGPRGADHVCAPPLRARGHQAALWEALAAGGLAAVSTDHCPFTSAQKSLGADDFRKIPGGVPGIEHRLALLYTHGVRAGRIDRFRFVDLVATAPAKLCGLYPRKGSLAEGADADLVIWDPEVRATISAASHRHRCDRSVFEGVEVRGAPVLVVTAGRVAFEGGEVVAPAGAGRYLERGRPALP